MAGVVFAQAYQVHRYEVRALDDLRCGVFWLIFGHSVPVRAPNLTIE